MVKGKSNTDLTALGSNLEEETRPKGKRVRIILEENENIPPTGQFFGIQGEGYILRPGEAADVPVELIEVLNNAVQSVPVLDSAQTVVEYREKLRFPYRIVQPGSDTRIG